MVILMAWEIPQNWIDGYISVVNTCLKNNDVFRAFKSNSGYTIILGDGSMPKDQMQSLYNETIG
jgi:hypothetical protein